MKSCSPCPFCGSNSEIIGGKVYCRGPQDCASASPEDWERVALAAIALKHVSGALVDSGDCVPENPVLYGEAVRKITRERDRGAEIVRAIKQGVDSRPPTKYLRDFLFKPSTLAEKK